MQYPALQPVPFTPKGHRQRVFKSLCGRLRVSYTFGQGSGHPVWTEKRYRRHAAAWSAVPLRGEHSIQVLSMGDTKKSKLITDVQR